MRHLMLALCALAIAAPARAQDASGNWQLTVTTAARGTQNTSMSLKKDGDKLSGTMIGPRDSVLTLAGTQTGADIELSFSVPTEDGPMAVSMSGRQDGDSMKGTLRYGTDGQGDWTADRNAAGRTAAAIDLTGTWALQVVTEMGTRTPSVTLKQEGDKLTGQYKSQLGEAPVSGQIKGSAFSFEVTLPIEGTPMTILYTGTAGTDGVSGKITVGDADVGTFSGKKQASG